MATEIAIAVYLGECCGHVPLVIAVLILCSVILEDDKSATFLRGDCCCCCCVRVLHPPTTKVIQRRDLGLKSHPKDFLRGDKFFRTLSRRKIRTNDITSKHQLLHFMTSKKVKTDIFVLVIYN